MTVHGQRSKSPDSAHIAPLVSHPNGYNISKVVYPHVNMNRSWNGLVFHVSPLTNGDAVEVHERRDSRDVTRSISAPENSGHHPTWSNSYSNKHFLYYPNAPAKTLGNSLDEQSFLSKSHDSFEEETEYVTLDNNYIYPHKTVPLTYQSKHLSLLDFKKANGTVRTDQVRIINNQIHQTDSGKTGGSGDTGSLKERQKYRSSLKKIAENIGSVLSPRGGGSLRRGEVCENKSGMGRSKSVGDLRYEEEQEREEEDDSKSCCYSDDDDGDDFGFLSSPWASSCISLTAMSKNKSPGQSHRILPKKWRSKTKPLPGATSCLWSSQGNCTWCSVSGRKVVVKPTTLLNLTETERLALQKIALNKLQAMNLGCQVTLPKECTETRRHKRPTLSFARTRRAHSANLSSLIDKVSSSDKDQKDHQPNGLVFGIPISKCIANDTELQKRKSATSLRDRPEDVIIYRREPRKSSSSSHSSLDNLAENGTSGLSSDGMNRRVPSTDSLSESDCSRNTNNSSLLDALFLSTSRHGSLRTEHLPFYTSGVPQVPQVVNTCFKHIETYGLRVLGIFRVGSSKKRVKQLREEFDTGKDVKLNESHNPHDVGALLKEYFRDLPEPLLTRDLYSPLVASRRFTSRNDQLTSLQYLVSLLPVPNRDTLFALLNFLSTVDAHSTDVVDENNEILPGNKMGAHNLATLFGPNILHKCKSSEKEFLVESVERMEERKEVIEVVQDMIDNHYNVFEVSAEIYDEVLRALVESDPETADSLLKKMANDMGEPDPDTTSSSLFDDSDNASLPHSPCSDADLGHPAATQRLSGLHPPLRNSQSAEVMTPRTRRKFFFSNSDHDKNKNREHTDTTKTEKEKPRFRLRFDRSPSPKPRTPRSVRPPKVKISKDSSSPEVVMRRPRSEYLERPHSENLSNCLAIPTPNYARQNSSSSISSYINTSSTNSPVGSESSGQWLLPTPPASGSNSPKTSRRVTSSQQRPLGIHGSNSDISASPRGLTPAWEREKWRQWEIVAAENADDAYEKETLV